MKKPLIAGILLLTLIIGTVLYFESYVIHGGFTFYPDGERPTSRLCDGLTVVLGDPEAHYSDGSVRGICIGSVKERPSLTSEEFLKMNGSRFFYFNF